jgi:hypothetical protein
MIDYIKTWIALKADKRAIAGVIVTSAGTIGTNISAKFTSLAGSI